MGRKPTKKPAGALSPVMGLGADPYHRSLRVAIPRFPHFLYASYENWFRTTVNPLVWELVKPEWREFPVPSTALPEIHEFNGSGLSIDTGFWGLSSLEDERLPLEERFTYRPDAILDLRYASQLFDLLTSGRREDRVRGLELLRLLGLRRAGAEPTTEKHGPFTDTTWSGPKQRVQGREALGNDLSVQLRVWKVKQDLGDGPDTRVIKEVCREHEISHSHIRNHIRARDEYLELLRGNLLVRKAAGTIYPGAPTPEETALASLSDAIAWLVRGD